MANVMGQALLDLTFFFHWEAFLLESWLTAQTVSTQATTLPRQ